MHICFTGFLGTGHPNANGNQALLDLLAVLTWIKENIASFDGDPNRVTLFGHGHGAALVNFLLFVQTVKRGTLITLGYPYYYYLI